LLLLLLGIPRWVATLPQCRKRIKKRPLSERSEFRTLPVSGTGGACSPCEARTAIVGAAFLPHFLAEPSMSG
jgi:hypothetical protein